MDWKNLAHCARALIELAGLIREEAHGRIDALELHDIARTLEASADRLVALDRNAGSRTTPST